MLLRMYVRWAEQHGYKVDIIEETRGRRSRPQIGDHRGQGPQRLWLAEDRKRRAPPGAHLAVRLQCPPPHLVRQRQRLPGGRRPYQYRHQGIRRPRRYLCAPAALAASTSTRRNPPSASPTSRPISRWSARTTARSTSNRAQAWQMLRAQTLRAGIEEARGKGHSRPGRQDRYRLGPPDPLLRAAALSDGERSAYRRVDLEHRCACSTATSISSPPRRWRKKHSAPRRPKSRMWSREPPRHGDHAAAKIAFFTDCGNAIDRKSSLGYR